MRRDRRRQMQQIVPMFHNESGVDRCADMVGQSRIGAGLLEGVEFPVLEVSQSGSEALSNQGKQRKHVIAGAAGIREVLFDIEEGVMIEQPVQNIGRLAFGRADRQDAEVAILVGKMTVEFGARLAAVVEIDVAAFCSAVACAEELPVR